jgi:hypothetical protein
MVFRYSAVQTFADFEVVGEKVILQNGCFRRTLYWLRGRLALPYAKYVEGWTGPETVVEVDSISPSITA